jgi:hypothetical protein
MFLAALPARKLLPGWSMPLKSWIARLLGAGLAAGVAACGSDGLVLPDQGRTSKVAVVSGDDQTGAAGATLIDNLVVFATDERGRPVEGQAIVFTAASGSGSVTPDTVVTDGTGHATAQWTLGPATGAQEVQATALVNGALDPNLAVTFGATAVAGNAARLVFLVQPSNTTAGEVMLPAVKVEVQDQNGNRVSATTPVTLAIASNPGGSTLTGAGPVNAVNGVATFTNLSLNHVGANYTLTATAPGGFAAATSVGFTIAAAEPDHLELSLPGSAAAGATITPAQVTVRDAFGNVAVSPSVSITMAIQNNPTAGTLSGTKTVATVNGVATFTNLSIDKAGNGYTLRATGGGMGLTSGALNILPGNVNRLSFQLAPTSATVGAPLGTIEVWVQDASGNLVTTASNSISIASSVTGSLSGTSTVAAVNGIARFTNLAITKAGTGYQLIAHGSGLADATSGAFNVAKAATTVTILSQNPSGASVVGQAVTVNYTVDVTAPGTGNPTGNVVVSDGTTSCVGSVAGGTGNGNCTLTFASVGPRTLTATYAGDINFQGSTSAGASYSVSQASTTTVITSDAPDPSQVGGEILVKWNVNVTSPGGGTPGGTVTVTMAGDDATCTAVASAHQCSLTPTTAGTVRTLTATYSGDGNYNGSTDTELHVVNKASTTTTITSDSPDPSVGGQTVTVAFTVTSAAGTPTGNVTVSASGTESCTAAVSAGSCDLTLTIPGASRTITATYAGDADFAGSSDTESHQVNILNTAPQANDDAYAVDEDGSLNVAANGGVLKNDTDAQTQSTDLTATLVSGPAHASAFTLNADGSFSYTPAANFNGSDSFTYRASDGQLESGVATVTITVDAVNDAPSFTKGSPVNVTTADGAQTIANWASGMSAGPTDESGQTLAFQASNNNSALFASGGEPSIDADGTLHFTPAGIEGTATVTVHLTDNGGTGSGGADTSASQTFVITVGPVPEPSP